jgi:hypothetical protein
MRSGKVARLTFEGLPSQTGPSDQDGLERPFRDLATTRCHPSLLSAARGECSGAEPGNGQRADPAKVVRLLVGRLSNRCIRA